MVTPTVKDRDWIRQSFLVTTANLAKVDGQNRSFTSASLKFTDTTPGGNFAINPLPQFTRTADIKAPSMFTGSKGMGRVYSEWFDDKAQIVHMRFGVATFNSLTQFFTGFYNTGAGQLVRTGRATGALYLLGKAAGFVASIISWKLLAAHLIGTGLKFFLQKPSSKFYYLKPTMPLYWSAVQGMVNQIAVNRGIIPRLGGNGDPYNTQQKINNDYSFTDDARATLNKQLPDIFNFGGGLDVYAMANRAQRLARKRQKIFLDAIGADSFTPDLTSTMNQLSSAIQTATTTLTDVSPRPSFSSYLSKWAPGASSLPTGASSSQGAASSAGTQQAAPTQGGDLSTENLLLPIPPTNPKSTADWQAPPEAAGFAEFLEAELDDGGAFASFRVNYTGHVGESFSNTVGESELQNKINSMSSAGRSTNFDFAHGNIDNGVLGKMLGSIIGGVTDFAAGIGDALHISGIAALGGAAFVDIPKYWQSASANLQRGSYTMELRSPYGNPISQLINIYVPLCMILAGALPRSTGKQSYAEPFLVEFYDKGRCQSRLGMIDSISITRGVGNLGFNEDGHAMGIDVSFSIIDMSSLIHMPITQGFSTAGMEFGAALGGAVGVVGGAAAGSPGGVGGAAAGAAAGGTAGAAVGGGIGSAVDAAANLVTAVASVFDEDNSFTDYMAILAGQSLTDQIYSSRKLKLNLTRALANWNTWYSTSHYASFAGDTFPARLWSALYRGTARS